MPKLRDALKQTSGVDVGGNPYTLQETDVQPYIDNPEIAQMEADVTKARYGGKAIQDVASSMPAAGAPPTGAPRTQAIDFSRRGDFEKSVFKQLASETIPDGNPFNFNPTASLNAISKQDLPELFTNIFRNDVTWQDRHLLDDEQKKFWMSEVKRYRAHVKNSLESERQAAINGYNQMMNQFDNAAKEQQATARIVSQKRQAQAKRRLGIQKETQALTKRRMENLTEEGKLIQRILEAEDAKKVDLKTDPGSFEEELQTSQTDIFIKQLQALRAERKAIDVELQSRQTPKPKSGITKVAAIPGKKTPAKPEVEKDAEGKTIVRKTVPKQGQKTPAKPEVEKDAEGKTIVRTAMHKGNKVLIYSDGRKAYADEVE